MTRLVRWSAPKALAPSGAVVTLGNFDGVHRAHRHMLDTVLRHARAESLCASVVTFEPTPREFFQGDEAPPRLMTLVEKHRALRQLGVDLHVSVRFDQRVADLSPRSFTAALLRDSLRARHVVIGDDFRYGRQRAGDVAALRAFGQEAGFGVTQIDAVTHAGVRVSSTAIRQALRVGDFATAEALLGRAYSMSGRVVHGQKLGRTLGFATANIRPRRRVLPIQGVLAVRVSDGHELCEHPAVASLGTRPTVNGRGHLLEVHLFDFQGNLYGRRLTVRFVRKLRDEVRFASLDEMTDQMHRDAHDARRALAEEAD